MVGRLAGAEGIAKGQLRLGEGGEGEGIVGLSSQRPLGKTGRRVRIDRDGQTGRGAEHQRRSPEIQGRFRQHGARGVQVTGILKHPGFQDQQTGLARTPGKSHVDFPRRLRRVAGQDPAQGGKLAVQSFIFRPLQQTLAERRLGGLEIAAQPLAMTNDLHKVG